MRCESDGSACMMMICRLSTFDRIVYAEHGRPQTALKSNPDARCVTLVKVNAGVRSFVLLKGWRTYLINVAVAASS